MKKIRDLFSIITCFFLLSCHSMDSSRQHPLKYDHPNRTDTTFEVHSVSEEQANHGYFDKKYFISIKEDTLRLIYDFSKNISTQKVAMRLFLLPFNKKYTPKNSVDTATMEKQMSTRYVSMVKLSRQQEIKIFSLVLNKASLDFDLKNISHIRFSLSSFEGFDSDIMRTYNKASGSDLAKSNVVAKIIKQAQLINQLNKVLVKYSLAINEVNIDGLVFYIPQNLRYEEKISSNSDSSKKVKLDGLVILSLKHL